uniref:Testis specific protein Y-linked n=1 Tax=Tetraodon nigroviridis TaxID=99883 RepID=H3D4P2_TETNG
MSEATDCKQSESAARKRRPSPERDGDGTASKTLKLADGQARVASERCDGNEADSNFGGKAQSEAGAEDGEEAAVVRADPEAAGTTAQPVKNSGGRGDRNRSDAAAIVAAEALASLTAGDEEKKAKQTKQGSKFRARGSQHSAGAGASSRTQAAAADSSTSVLRAGGEEGKDLPEAEEGDDSLSGSSSTPSSSFPSDNEDNDDGECAIVSVKMAPEMRQSVALLAQVQMRLEALEKKSARLHQRLELKIRQRRPHLDQRSSYRQDHPRLVPLQLLNHPHLSAHIDETDEDALSYMTDLEIESFDNNKVYRIRFHFRRNPYFQNNIIMKELHVGVREGPPRSFSNPILWHRGQNLTANSEPRKSSRGVYQTFFNWFSDHGNPRQDDVAQILKDDLYRDPLRYYLTPLWEPRENGSGGGSGAKTGDNSKGDECVVISDSDDDPDEDEPGPGSDDSEQDDE